MEYIILSLVINDFRQGLYSYADIPNWSRRCSVKALATAILGSTPRSAIKHKILLGINKSLKMIVYNCRKLLFYQVY
jgi:hypothetical protein